MFSYEPYLNIDDQLSVNSISKLRCGSHNLFVETGRWNRPLIPRANRICQLCNQNQIEDEYHVLTPTVT
jgi:hypothetical protein